MKIEEDEAWVEKCQFEPSGSDFEDDLDKPCGSCGPCGPVPSAFEKEDERRQMKMDEELAKRLESSDDILTVATSLPNKVSAIDLT